MAQYMARILQVSRSIQRLHEKMYREEDKYQLLEMAQALVDLDKERDELWDNHNKIVANLDKDDDSDETYYDTGVSQEELLQAVSLSGIACGVARRSHELDPHDAMKLRAMQRAFWHHRSIYEEAERRFVW